MGQRVEPREDRHHGRRIAHVDGQQDLSHRPAVVGKRIAQVELHRVEDDTPRQRVAVGVQSVRRVADQHVAGTHAVAVQRVVFLHDADDRPRKIVVPLGVQIRQLRGLAARQHHAVRAAAARHAGDDRRGDLGHERAGGDVILERQRRRAVHQDVVDAVVDEVLTDRVVDPRADRDEHLGPDAVGREHEDRLAHPGGHADHAAERADLPQRERGAGGAGQLGDAALRLFGGVEAHAGGGVAVGHGAAVVRSNHTSA